MKHKLFKLIVQSYAMMFPTRKDTWTEHAVSTAGSLKIGNVMAPSVALHTERQTEIYKYYFINKFINKR